MKSLLLGAALVAAPLLLAPTASAQIRKASASPRGTLQQEVGLAKVNLDYGRPGVKGREIFGALEPYGKVWRTGANSSTKISFDRAVEFGGRGVPAGNYALYTIPEKKEWTVILSKNTGLWGAGGYDPAQDQVRIQVPVQKRADLTETLTIDFEGFHANGADLTIRWAHVGISVPISVDSDPEVYDQIDEKITNAKGNVAPQTYFDAAMFYYEKGVDLPQAAEWIDKAVAGSPGAFWMVYYQAELAHAMEDMDLAKTLAELAMEQAGASRGGDFGYIAKSQLLLAKIQG